MHRTVARLCRPLIFAGLTFTVVLHVVLAEGEEHSVSEEQSSAYSILKVQRGGISRRARSRRYSCGVGVPPTQAAAPPPSLDCSACEATQCRTPCTNTVSRVCASCSSLPSCPESNYRSGCACVACDICPPGLVRKDCGGCSQGSCVSVSAPCRSCAAGQYAECPGACITCPTQSTSPANSMSIADCVCNEGYTGPDGTSCTACPAGTYKNNRGKASCAFCPAGKYADQIGSSACSDCAAGKYSFAGSTSCADCESGTYESSAGSKACSSCPAYSFPDANSASCICNNGYTGPDGTSCIACPQGTYKNKRGTASCTACPAGKSSLVAAATSMDMCTDPLGDAAPSFAFELQFAIPRKDFLSQQDTFIKAIARSTNAHPLDVTVRSLTETNTYTKAVTQVQTLDPQALDQRLTLGVINRELSAAKLKQAATMCCAVATKTPTPTQPQAGTGQRGGGVKASASSSCRSHTTYICIYMLVYLLYISA